MACHLCGKTIGVEQLKWLRGGLVCISCYWTYEYLQQTAVLTPNDPQIKSALLLAEKKLKVFISVGDCLRYARENWRDPKDDGQAPT